MLKKLYENFTGVKIALCAVCLLVYCAGVALAGGSVPGLFIFHIFMAGYVILPGLALRKFAGLKGGLSPAVCLGAAFLRLCYIFSQFLGNFLPLKIFPLALGAVFLVKYGRDFKKLEFDRGQFLRLALVWRAGMFVFTFLVAAKHAHPTAAGQLLISQDLMWTVGNAESLKISFPPRDIRFSGVTLKYHYLTELLAACASIDTGLGCYDIVAFYMQGFMLGFFILAVWELGREYCKSDFKADMFVLSFFCLSCLSLWKPLTTGYGVFSNNMLQAILGNLNSQATSLGFLAVFFTLLIRLSEEKEAGRGLYLSGAAAFLLLTFSKSPVRAILSLAMLCACVINLISKNRNFRFIVFAAAMAGLFGRIYFGYLSRGTGKSAVFSPVKTLELGYFKNFIALFRAKNKYLYLASIPLFMAVQTVCMAPFQSLVALPGAVLDIPKIFKLSPAKLTAYGCVAGGLLAFFLFYHEAFSQVYFLYRALFFMNLLAVDRFKFEKISPKNATAYLFAALSCFTSLILYINFCGSGLRQYLFHYNILEKYPYAYCVKAEDELAGEYLRRNMAEGELFITNRTHTGRGEGLSNVYTCFSGRQSYMEGFKYTVSNMGISFEDMVAPRLEDVGKVFGIYEQTPAGRREILEICRDKGIRYGVYSRQFEGDNPRLDEFEIVFRQGTVTVYKFY